MRTKDKEYLYNMLSPKWVFDNILDFADTDREFKQMFGIGKLRASKVFLGLLDELRPQIYERKNLGE